MFYGITISILSFLLAKLWYDNLMLRMENENLKRDLNNILMKGGKKMKIQDFINELEIIKNEYGNIEVRFEDNDNYSGKTVYDENIELYIRGIGEENVSMLIIGN